MTLNGVVAVILHEFSLGANNYVKVAEGRPYSPEQKCGPSPISSV